MIPPMCNDDDREFDQNDYEVSDNAVKVRNYSDDSSSYNFGGMIGTVNYDKFGNEC